MLEKFITYCQDQKLYDSTQQVLLAVSGGLDSMVMLHLFSKAGFSFSVAHFNFNLRGAESDDDEIFLSNYCDQNNIRFYRNSFDTREYALQEGISIEMAARDLRYNWFSELVKKENFNSLATAHHQDDVLETFFINLARGTGIRGLSGIKVKSDYLIRPMLFTNREELKKYAEQQGIPYREDSTNKDVEIKRNFIRHKVLPLLEEYNSSFRKNALKTSSNLLQVEEVYLQKIKEVTNHLLVNNGRDWLISIPELKKLQPIRTYLFELLKRFNFNIDQLDEIIASLGAGSGKKFYSASHRLVKDREHIIVSPNVDKQEQIFYIEEDCVEIDQPLKMEFTQLEHDSDYKLSRRDLIVDFDLDKLQFPLMLRKWNEGEYFQPLGMSGFKKLSDFFIDEKYSIPEKESSWIMASGDKVVWIVGKRIDNRFKITGSTKNVLRIKLF